MISLDNWILFAAAAFVMVITPGPNMVYLISRSICQGKRAGVVSLLGVVAGFFVHMLAAAFGLTALLLVVPVLFTAIKWAGVMYLGYLAWQAVRPGSRSPFEAQDLQTDTPWRLFSMGFLTNLLNPKIAVFYLSIFPQFVSPEMGSVFAQSIQLGMTQISVSFGVNLAIVMSASRLSAWFSRNPARLAAQRYVMGTVLLSLAARMAFESPRTT